MKSVCLSYTPLTEGLLKLLPIEPAAEAGLESEYWDLSELYGHASRAGQIERPFVRRFQSWAALEEALAGPESAALFITAALPEEPRFFRLRRLLGRSRARLACVVSGVLPAPPALGTRSWREDAARLLRPGKLRHAVLKRAQAGLKRLGVPRGWDVVFAAGAAAREQAGGARVVPINHHDYDDWLAWKDRDERLVPGRYAVYLDQFAAGHPDFKFLGLEKLIDPEVYYRLLNGFFTAVESQLGLEVVVAAHPKADYPVNPFAGRKIFRSKTRPLARHCELALATHSTSISYAVIGRKPLLFFTTQDIKRLYRPLRLDVFPALFASVLGRPCVTLDALPAELPMPEVDERLYSAYERRYLASPESAGRSTRDVYREFFGTAVVEAS